MTGRDTTRLASKDVEVEQADAAGVIVDHPELPNQRRCEEAADDGVDHRIVAFVSQVDESSAVGALG